MEVEVLFPDNIRSRNKNWETNNNQINVKTWSICSLFFDTYVYIRISKNLEHQQISLRTHNNRIGINILRTETIDTFYITILEYEKYQLLKNNPLFQLYFLPNSRVIFLFQFLFSSYCQRNCSEVVFRTCWKNRILPKSSQLSSWQ